MTTARTALLLALAGCTFPTTGGSGSSWTAAETTDPLEPPDAACLAELPVDEQTALQQTIDETGSSYHEMVACGGLAFELSRSVAEVFLTGLLGAQGLTVPGGFVWEGEGRYRSSGTTADMVVEYRYGDDLAAGGLEDQPIEHDLFDLDNYLRGVSLTANDDFSIDLSWTETGPLVELLGRGANPANPLTLSLDDLYLPHRLGRIKVLSEIEVVDSRADATVTYTLVSKAKRLNPMLGDSELAFDHLATQTVHRSGAILQTTTWGIAYVDQAPGALDGEIDFAYASDRVQAEGTYRFDNSTYPTTTWQCVPPEG